MYRYLVIDLLVLSVPLMFSFWGKPKFYRRVPYVLAAFFSVGVVFLTWDVWATAQGDWGFSHQYLVGIHFLGLPLEEILFFLMIPYSCLFIYENLVCYFNDRRILIPRFLNVLVAGASGIAAVLFWSQNYTRTVFIFFGLFFLTTLFFDHDMLESSLFLIYMAITYFPFFLVNYLLTSAPIVWYNPQAIWGVRITTIPLEDFLYSFTMLAFYTLIYRIFRKRTSKGPFLKI
ncbi:MAG: lycopene cyclase domain-containing protein [Candidatus Aminicenantes bacterium]|nr:lycopene cyclase domain-containing protein [Candidatus Aminicenantes bacterium]